jgi:hypothetical protein
VDVLATYGSAAVGQPHTEVVVAGVEVLFVLGPAGFPSASRTSGHGLDVAGAGAEDTVTLLLLVSPDQETRLAFARAFANLEVVIAPAVAHSA